MYMYSSPGGGGGGRVLPYMGYIKCGPFLDTQICVEVFVELFACTGKVTFSSFFILPLPDMPLFS